MTTSPLKAEDSRADFEVWANRQPEAKRFGFAHRDGLGSYVHSWHKNAWSVWQASRTAIVVDTGYLLGDGDNEDSDYTLGFNQGITKADKAIRAAGITVKGD